MFFVKALESEGGHSRRISCCLYVVLRDVTAENGVLYRMEADHAVTACVVVAPAEQEHVLGRERPHSLRVSNDSCRQGLRALPVVEIIDGAYLPGRSMFTCGTPARKQA